VQAADFFLVFTRPLDQADIPYMVAGSVASMVYGEPRLTNDIDLVVVLDEQYSRTLGQLFPADRFYCPPPETVTAETRRLRQGHFNIIHHDSGMKADVYPAGTEALQAWGLAHRRRVELERDQGLWIAPAEYVILKKLEYYREGRTEKHLHDIRGMLAVSGDQMDTAFLDAWIEDLELTAEWNQVRQN